MIIRFRTEQFPPEADKKPLRADARLMQSGGPARRAIWRGTMRVTVRDKYPDASAILLNLAKELSKVHRENQPACRRHGTPPFFWGFYFTMPYANKAQGIFVSLARY